MNTKAKVFTKQEVLSKLSVQPYILSLWEKKASLSPFLKEGETFYEEADVQKLLSLKELLYEKGHTLDTALRSLQKNQLPQDPPPFIPSTPFKPVQIHQRQSTLVEKTEFSQKLLLLREKLKTLSNLLS